MDSILYDSISEFIRENSNGLHLIDLPPGTGKTYSVSRFMCESLYDLSVQEALKGTHIIFVTQQKRNLPEEELFKRFKAIGKEALFAQTVLFLDANADNLFSILGGEDQGDGIEKRRKLESLLPAEILNSKEYRSIIDNIRMQEVPSLSVSLRNKLKEELGELERKFRVLIKGMIESGFPKLPGEDVEEMVSRRLDAIENDRCWQWVGRLYPSVFTRRRKILLMSMDKLLCPHDTLVEAPYAFIDSPIMEKAVLFVDEFDATKKVVLRKIISDRIGAKIDIVDMFRTVYAVLKSRVRFIKGKGRKPSFHTSLPTDVVEPSQWFLSSKNRKVPHPKVLIQTLWELGDAIYQDYNLLFPCRTERSRDDLGGNAIFQDFEHFTIYNNNDSQEVTPSDGSKNKPGVSKRYIRISPDSKARMNYIKITKNQPKEKGNIISFLGKIDHFFRYFFAIVPILTSNYVHNLIEKKHRSFMDAEFTSTDVESIVSACFLQNPHGEYVPYAVQKVMEVARQTYSRSDNKDNKADVDEFDFSFYERGFNYYAFINSSNRDLETQIAKYDFSVTPERVLLQFCKKARVVGISATATLETAIGNYDLSYLRKKLGKQFVPISHSRRYALEQKYKDLIRGYADVFIHTELVNSDVFSWEALFENKERAEVAENKVKTALSRRGDPKTGQYFEARYWRAVYAFRQFELHEDIHSFLCLFNKLPKKWDSEFDEDLLQDLFKIIHEDLLALGLVSSSYNAEILRGTGENGENFDGCKKKIREALEADRRTFVLSTYQTVGAGQNLQYKAPERLRKSLIPINDRFDGQDWLKDFDALYLDKPTNILTNLSSPVLSEEAFVSSLFQVEEMQENGEVSRDETKKLIRLAFHKYFGYYTPNVFSSLYNKPSVLRYCTQLIIQGVGRLSRTNLKNRNIYVFADANLSSAIDLSVIKGELYTPELLALVKCLTSVTLPSEEASLIALANIRSIQSNGFIKRFLPSRSPWVSNHWTTSSMAQWAMLRQYFLTYPTLPKNGFPNNSISNNFYVQIPKENLGYFYWQQGDFSKVDISFHKDETHPCCVSAAHSRLTKMMEIPGMKKFFENNGWATEWEQNEFLLTPPAFQNIYKGALGEVVGKRLLETSFPIVVSDITDPEIFERFDYYIEGTSIFVDFKNWSEGSEFDRKTLLQKAVEKAHQCGAKCVLFINVATRNRYKGSVSDIGGVRICEIPQLVYGEMGHLEYDDEMFWLIRECLDEYKN